MGARLCFGVGGTHHLTLHPPRDLGLMPLLPASATSPAGPVATREPLPRPCISRQVLLNKYPIAMQGGSWVPPRFERPHKPGPLCPSWNPLPVPHRHGDPVPASAPRPVPVWQRGRGTGCSLTKDGVRAAGARGWGTPGGPFATWRGDVIFLSLQPRGAREEPGGGSPGVGTCWGWEVGRKGTVTPQGGRLGVAGVFLSLAGPVFPQGSAGRERWGVPVTSSPPQAQGVLRRAPACHSVPHVPPGSHRVPPFAVGAASPMPRGARRPPAPNPGDCFPPLPHAFPTPCLATRPLCPAALAGTRPSAAQPGPPGGPASARLRRSRRGGQGDPTSLPAPACPPCSRLQEGGGKKKKKQ